MELVKVAPSRDAALIVGIDRGIDKLICDVHRNFSEIVSHALEHDAHHTAVGFDIRGMVEQVKGACTVELSIGCKPSLPPTTSSHRDSRKSAFMERGLSSSLPPIWMSIGLM